MHAERGQREVDRVAVRLAAAFGRLGMTAAVRGFDAVSSDAPDPVQVVSDLDAAAHAHDVVIAALHGPFQQGVLAAFDSAHGVLVLTDGSVPGVRALKRLLRLTTSLGLGADRVGVALVVGLGAVMDADSVAVALQRPVLQSIPRRELDEPDDAGGHPRWIDLAQRLVEGAASLA